jgi:hypothetical protein
MTHYEITFKLLEVADKPEKEFIQKELELTYPKEYKQSIQWINKVIQYHRKKDLSGK